jgi:uncharacterized protein YlxW (UPF0749 family)
VDRQRWWRALGAFGAFVAAGALFSTSALNSHGVDLRASSVTDLDTLVLHEKNRVDELHVRVANLNTEVAALTTQVGDSAVSELQTRVDRLKGPAGFAAVAGPGVTVTLDDAPKDKINAAIEDGSVSPDQLVVHQQDIQAVVNALWLGGAEAITVQGQRIISTTGIKCVGNTVVLHGVPYSPPYVIAAVGDPLGLVGAIDDSTYVASYQVFVDQYDLGWDLETSSALSVPAYQGTPDLHYAELGPTR